jgi:HJR/Mrr/RecB family endonuclease
VEQTVVVEVKHYARRSVGLEIVDRLNGVRDREHADRAVVFTSSSFSTDVKRRYAASSKRVALVDFQRLVEFLQAGKGRWKETASKLWTLPYDDVRAPG